ncbi:glycosyltransferase family 2 protein [Phosphitispora sp. TUW77]|uniref:glycosyltransferase family 2 protein n=1 Tax=Phosphitispora sp. TUW77 TaxID=3152361 RepID=UPI003AB5F485
MSNDMNCQYQKWLRKNDNTVGEKRNAIEKGITGEKSVFPLISVVILASKSGIDIIEPVVNSVLNQDTDQWFMVIIENRLFAHDVKEYLKQLSEEDHRIITIKSEENEAVSQVLNKVINNLESKYVLVLEEIGVLRPNAIRLFAREARESNYPDLIYADEDKLNIAVGHRSDPIFKPGWSPNLLYSFNYIGSPVIIRKELLQELGGFREHYGSCLNFDLLLRLTGQKLNVSRIPQVLFSKIINVSCKDDLEIKECQELWAIRESFLRRGYESRVTKGKEMGTFNYRLNIRKAEPVSIIIPTKNNAEVLRRCLESIEDKSTYSNYEVIVIDNGSNEENTLNYLKSLEGMKGFKILKYPEEFNYPDINNLGAAEARGSHLVFLNDDTEVISSDWLEALLEHSQRPEIGAVGALLLFPNGMIQHAGVVVGMRGSASHAFYKSDGKSPGYMNLAVCVRNVSAVTAACMMIEKTKFNKVRGFNTSFRVAMNDIDLCIRLLEEGFYNIYTPHARLLHHESLTRGEFINEEEIKLFTTAHKEFLKKGDPYYHPALSLERNDYSLAV